MLWPLSCTALAAPGKSTRYLCLQGCLGHWAYRRLQTSFCSSHKCSHTGAGWDMSHDLTWDLSAKGIDFAIPAFGDGGSTVAPSSWHWQLCIHSPPLLNPTPSASNYQRVNYRHWYVVTGPTISWKGGGGKMNGELPLKSEDTECLSTWHTLSNRDGGGGLCFLHFGKMWSTE